MSGAYNAYKQQKLTEQWEEMMSYLDTDEGGDTAFIDMEEENSLGLSEEKHIIKQNAIEEERKKKEREKKKKEREEYIKRHMNGMLEIPKINLNLPVLKEATPQNLNITISKVKNTGNMGQKGNYAVAGHRSHVYGMNFNRLDEIAEGDIIIAKNGENTYEYTVIEKLYVYPHETWVLKSDKENKDITLITCHPFKKSTHRLIIKGRIIADE